MKKLFTFFAISAIVLGMASCGDGNEPDPKTAGFQFKVEALSTKVQCTVMPGNTKADYYKWVVSKSYADQKGGIEEFLKDFIKTYKYDYWRENEYIANGKSVGKTAIEPEMEYYVFACYVEKGKDEKATIISDIVYKEFKSMPAGRLNGLFTVGENKQVYFSQGNLYFSNVDGGEWRFADAQYYFLQKTATSSTTEWDCFYFGSGDRPYATDYEQLDGAIVDWGNNPIVNGGNQQRFWYTLSTEEWKHLFFDRANAQVRFGMGRILVDESYIVGLIILPDNWVTPDNVSFVASTTTGMHFNSEGVYRDDEEKNHYVDNTYTLSEWENMEFAGAVFLPDVPLWGGEACYWTSSTYNAGLFVGAKYLGFGRSYLSINGGVNPSILQFTVRLVCESN